MAPDPLLRIQNVSRSYGSWVALRDVSFDVQAGQIVGLLGPNGSGKTTLLRLISTYLLPHGGNIFVNGFDVLTSPLDVRRAIGYLPEGNILYEAMRVDNYLHFVGEAKGLAGESLKKRLDWCIDKCDLTPLLTKHCGECSRGMRQRVSLAAALIHNPKVILLDEPTAGLDPVQSATLRALIQSLAEDRAILFSSHIFSEVASVTSQAVILHEGRLVTQVTLEDPHGRSEKLERLFMDAVRSPLPS